MPFQHAIHLLSNASGDAAINAEYYKTKPENKLKAAQTRQELNKAITFLKLGQFGGLTALVSLVRQWGTDRNIIGPDAKATVESQYLKLAEEFEELGEGIAKKDQHEIVDAIGDMTVVLILLSELAGVRFETCLIAAYDEIKDRKGSMIDGAYVKEAK